MVGPGNKTSGYQWCGRCIEVKGKGNGRPHLGMTQVCWHKPVPTAVPPLPLLPYNVPSFHPGRWSESAERLRSQPEWILGKTYRSKECERIGVGGGPSLRDAHVVIATMAVLMEKREG